MENRKYWVQTTRGELLAEFPYTFDGFCSAAHYHVHRMTELKSTEHLDYDNPSGLSQNEKDMLEEWWGELP